ncbi:MAG TPA: ATP-binding protein [Solirubrobacterales bacterium]
MDAVPVAGSKRLTPDPRSLEALGRNHTLEAAIAELVDNSIDAGADNILVRFVREEGRLSRLLVVDDGGGMDDEQIDVAMTVGGDRDYADGEIGRFGLGLKAASFSQARSVTLVSRAAGSPGTGRRWQVDRAKSDYECEIVEPGFADELLGRDWGFPALATGTVVRWDDVKGFPATDDEIEIDRFLHGAIGRIRTHLGMIFHRILGAGTVRLTIDVEERDDVLNSAEVQPLDPFGYPHSGAPGWPKLLRAEGKGGSLDLNCHIWPGRSSLDEYRLDSDLIQRQGLYVYYNDRLVQSGGWNGLLHADKQLSLARTAVDIVGDVDQMVALKPEKNGIETGPEFNRAIYAAETSDGLQFKDYADEARGVLKESNRRRSKRRAVIPPGKGFAPRVRRAFEKELPFKDEEPIEIRWEYLDGDEFFEIDRERGVLWLNTHYRKAVTGDQRAAFNDAPIVKALMFLLMEDIFSGQIMGSKDKDNVELWQGILAAAAEEELR